MQQYSDFFKTLHDETNPTGYLGRGTHYSILRAVVFHDPMGNPLPEGQFADFAVIWDEDHDVRVMEPIEEIYRRGLLSSFLMFGECKGSFTAILSNKVSSAIEAIPFNPVFLSSVDELPLSVRSANCLKNDNIVYIGDLVQKTEAEMLGTPNFGRKSLSEIEHVLVQMGLHIGMEVPGWPPANIEEIVKNKARAGFLKTEINAICQSLNDPWASTVVALGSAGNPIIDDEDEKVSLYLRNLEMLWRLATVTRQRQKLAMVSDIDRHSVCPERPAADTDENAPGRATDPLEADSL
jgi:Bacterial RNA polymerase, alpha chain C terminal domain